MSWIKQVFSIDLRSLALFRVSLALLILADLFLRSFDLVAFYTDEGVLPRSSWLNISNHYHLSLHAASGDLAWQVLLFILAAVFAIGLLVGYRTKLMALSSFILLASLINRNELITQAGDQLLVVMCFWSLFLPIGARYSVDAALNPSYKTNPNNHAYQPNKAQPFFGIASIAAIFQVLYLYLFTAILKTGAAWRVRYDAAFYAVSLDHFATPIGVWARQFAGLLKAGTVYVLLVEFIAPLLVLLPKPWPVMRIIAIALLASLHVAFLLMLHIGLFPLVDFMSLTLLIPSAFWIWMAGRRKPKQLDKIIMYYDEDCGFCLKMVLILRELLLSQNVQILPAQQNPDIYAIMEKENSWVIQGANGQHYIHWHAMKHLFDQRWVFKPIALIMSFPPFMFLGNKAYRWIANNRDTMSSITAATLPYKKPKLQPSIVGHILALFFFVGVTLYNITGIPGYGQYRPELVTRTIETARIDQRWSMFAPFPMTVSVYPQITGTLRNNDVVNLYPLTNHEETWQAPQDLYDSYKNYRWRKLMGTIRSTTNNDIRAAFGNYLCNRHNTNSTTEDQQLGIFDINFVLRHTNTTAEPSRLERNLAWRHWCYPEFAPAGK